MIYMNTLNILLYEYTEIMLGNRKNFSDNFLDGSRAQNERNAIMFIRLVSHVYFQCDSLNQAQALFSDEFIDVTKLRKVLNSVIVPEFIDSADRFDYIITKVFSRNFDSEKWAAQRYCERILRGSLTRFPKNYINEENGVTRSCYCLWYFLTMERPDAGALELMEFAVSPEFPKWLKTHLLSNACMKLFDDRIDFMFESFPNEMHDEMLYMIYKAKFLYNTTGAATPDE